MPAVNLKLIYRDTLPAEAPVEGRDFDYFTPGSNGTQPLIEGIPALQAFIQGKFPGFESDKGEFLLYGTFGGTGAQREALVDLRQVIRFEINTQ